MKRPDVSLRNKLNNPIHNKISLEKMRRSLTGKKTSIETKIKMSITRKELIRNNPSMTQPMLLGAEIKYLSKIRGKGWRIARLKALERDNNTCQGCGEKEKRLVVHHLDNKGRSLKSQRDMNNKLDNLITWCDDCHNKFHLCKTITTTK